MNPAVLTPEHVHTDTCWKENLACAMARVETLELELGECRTMIAQYQLVARELGSMVDKMEAAFNRVLSRNGRR
jgi:hypothetical protein